MRITRRRQERKPVTIAEINVSEILNWAFAGMTGLAALTSLDADGQ
jgi:hypothetical protein